MTMGGAAFLLFFSLVVLSHFQQQAVPESEQVSVIDVDSLVNQLDSPEESIDLYYRTGLNQIMSYWSDTLNSTEESSKVFQAVGLIRKAAEEGHSEAELVMGILHEQGRGVLQDYSAASRWYQSAVEKGNPNAMTRLGIMARKGGTGERDLVQAYVWLNIAASRGVPHAEMMRNKVATELDPEALISAQQRSRASEGLYPHVVYAVSPLPLDF